jgi:hypothetical protein
MDQKQDRAEWRPLAKEGNQGSVKALSLVPKEGTWGLGVEQRNAARRQQRSWEGRALGLGKSTGSCTT